MQDEPEPVLAKDLPDLMAPEMTEEKQPIVPSGSILDRLKQAERKAERQAERQATKMFGAKESIKSPYRARRERAHSPQKLQNRRRTKSPTKRRPTDAESILLIDEEERKLIEEIKMNSLIIEKMIKG